MGKVKRVDNYDYKVKMLNLIPEMLELLRKNKFTVKEAEAFLGRQSFKLAMDYLFYVNRDRGDNESINAV